MTMAGAQELYRCYHCGLESADSSFKYFDNKKADQPRYKCSHCHKFFTLGLHGRPQGKAYAKKRNEDPDELKCLSRQCRHCGVADNAVFKYYNNHNIWQPRFKCLSCGKQFQMRVLGTGEDRRLVHTSSAGQTRAPRRIGTARIHAQLAQPEENYETNFTSWTGNGDNSVPAPLSGEDAEFGDFLEEELLAQEKNEGSNDDALASTANVANAFPQTWTNEDAQLMNSTGAGVRYNELAQPEENYEADLTAWTSNGDNSVPAPLSGKDAEFGDFLEEELLAQEKNEGSIDDALASTANGANGFPQTWTNEDAELMNGTGAGVRYINEAPYAVTVSDSMSGMGPESTSNNVEVMYGTLASENPAATGSEPPTWTQNHTSVDPLNVDHLDDIATFCSQMDFEMAIENSTEQIDTPVDPYEDYLEDVEGYLEDDEAFKRQMDLDVAMWNYIPWNR